MNGRCVGMRERDISKLLSQYKEVWFWIDEEYQDRFFNDLIDMKVIFISGDPVTRDAIRHCMGVDNAGTVGYVSNLIWYNTFSNGNPPVKINYGKYISGEDDYIFSKPNIMPIDVNGLWGGNDDE